jgi:hypothetical protein
MQSLTPTIGVLYFTSGIIANWVYRIIINHIVNVLNHLASFNCAIEPFIKLLVVKFYEMFWNVLNLLFFNLTTSFLKLFLNNLIITIYFQEILFDFD